MASRLATAVLVLVLIADTVVAELVIFGVIAILPLGLVIVMFTIFGILVNGACQYFISALNPPLPSTPESGRSRPVEMGHETLGSDESIGSISAAT
jgi:hypothetical protein